MGRSIGWASTISMLSPAIIAALITLCQYGNWLKKFTPQEIVSMTFDIGCGDALHLDKF
jgi:hypothetical protein